MYRFIEYIEKKNKSIIAFITYDFLLARHKILSIDLTKFKIVI